MNGILDNNDTNLWSKLLIMIQTTINEINYYYVKSIPSFNSYTQFSKFMKIIVILDYKDTN